MPKFSIAAGGDLSVNGGGGSSGEMCSLLVTLPLLVSYGGVVKQDISSSASYVFPPCFPSARALLARSHDSCDMFVGQLQVDLVSFCCKKSQVSHVASVFTKLCKRRMALEKPIYVRCEGLKLRSVTAATHDVFTGGAQQRVYFSAVEVISELDRESFRTVEALVDQYVMKLVELKLVTVKSIARTQELFVVVRRFLNEPPRHPLNYYSKYICDGIQLSEMRLIFSKGTTQCPIKHLKVDPRFEGCEISCRPIVCDLDGRAARLEFARAKMPRVFFSAAAAYAHFAAEEAAFSLQEEDEEKRRREVDDEKVAALEAKLGSEETGKNSGKKVARNINGALAATAASKPLSSASCFQREGGPVQQSQQQSNTLEDKLTSGSAKVKAPCNNRREGNGSMIGGLSKDVDVEGCLLEAAASASLKSSNSGPQSQSALATATTSVSAEYDCDTKLCPSASASSSKGAVKERLLPLASNSSTTSTTPKSPTALSVAMSMDNDSPSEHQSTTGRSRPSSSSTRSDRLNALREAAEAMGGTSSMTSSGGCTSTTNGSPNVSPSGVNPPLLLSLVSLSEFQRDGGKGGGTPTLHSPKSNATAAGALVVVPPASDSLASVRVRH